MMDIAIALIIGLTLPILVLFAAWAIAKIASRRRVERYKRKMSEGE